jgi:hypothetical protein
VHVYIYMHVLYLNLMYKPVSVYIYCLMLHVVTWSHPRLKLPGLLPSDNVGMPCNPQQPQLLKRQKLSELFKNALDPMIFTLNVSRTNQFLCYNKCYIQVYNEYNELMNYELIDP